MRSSPHPADAPLATIAPGRAFSACSTARTRRTATERCAVENAHLRSVLCNQIVFRVRAETWALWNFDSAVDHRHATGERRRAEVGEHPLKGRIFFLCGEAMQRR